MSLQCYKLSISLHQIQKLIPEDFLLHWHIRNHEAFIAVAAKDSALIGQTITEELMKFLYYLGTQAIFNKYHSYLDPNLKDNSVTCMH